jgi:hypothetical protein
MICHVTPSILSTTHSILNSTANMPQIPFAPKRKKMGPTNAHALLELSQLGSIHPGCEIRDIKLD